MNKIDGAEKTNSSRADNGNAEFNGKMVAKGSKNYLCEILLPENRQHIYSSFSGHESSDSKFPCQTLLVLREVGQCLLGEIDEYLIHDLIVGYNKNNKFHPFKKELLLNLLSDEIRRPLVYFLIALRHQIKPVCKRYVEVFQSHLTNCTKSWSENEFSSQLDEEVGVFSILAQNNKTIKLDIKNNTSLFILQHFIEQYFFSSSNGTCSNALLPGTKTLIGVLSKYKETFSSAISNIVYHLYQQCELGFDEGNSVMLLTLFAQKGFIHKNEATELFKLLIAELNKPQAPILFQANALSLLSEFLVQNLVAMKANMDDIGALRDYLISKISTIREIHRNPEIGLIRNVIIVFTILAQKNAPIDAELANRLKCSNFAIIKESLSLYQQDEHLAMLQYHAIEFIIAILSNEEIKQAIEFKTDEIDLLKSFAQGPSQFLPKMNALLLLSEIIETPEWLSLISAYFLQSIHLDLDLEFPDISIPLDTCRSLISFYERCQKHSDQNVVAIASEYAIYFNGILLYRNVV